jgi:large subunit ribosomal protein L5
MTALKEKYRSEIVPKLKEELGLDNVMAVPRITKITLNMGVGEAVGDKKVLEHAVADMEKNRRPEGGGHQVTQIHCGLQNP